MKKKHFKTQFDGVPEVSREIVDDILKIKSQCQAANIDYRKLIYMPRIPCLGVKKDTLTAEICGMRVMFLITSPNE